MTHLLAFLPGVGPQEMLIFGVIAVLLFGSRLPEVGRSLGKSLMEFKKGLQGIESELHAAIHQPTKSSTGHSAARLRESDDRDVPTAPKFVPPSAEPSDASPSTDSSTSQVG